MTFFSHRPNFSDFPFLFLEFPYLYYVKCSISPFPHKKNHYFRKEFLYDSFFLICSYFRAHPTTLLLKILGDGCMGRSLTSNFGGDRPPVSPTCRSPPLVLWPVVRKRWDRC